MIARSKPMRRSRPRAIPALVRVAVRCRAKDTCEFPGCVRFLRPPEGHFHHVRKRSQGGEDTESNLRLLCPDHHEHVEQHPAEAVRLGLSVQLGKVAS